ncbi:hypothetical protein ACNTMW_27670 [Planosporangium sp. 12N6]|uniref:hypothetical protein n=1 Tax=Planosporangium spinosum TaxID=3402278 RepID=UPI003CE809F0
MGLAPVAALLVVFGGDRTGLVRIAVLLAVVAVGLIGASMVLRRDPEAMREQIEDMVFDELDQLRDDVREDITTAARATHKAFGERVVTLQESVDSLRGEVENLRVRVERGGVPAQPVSPAAAPPPPPMAPAPGVLPHHAVVPPHPVVAPHGVVRHTETVKVTTRQTIVDQNDRGPAGGTVYGGRAPEPPVVPAQRRPEHGGPARGGDARSGGEPWSERMMRERVADDRRADHHEEPRYGDPRYGDPRYGDDRPGAESWSGEVRNGRRHAEPDDSSGRISGVQAGDRWASVRSDDRGRELRVGERRAALHADGSGTELRIEDRWAAVRREDARRSEPGQWDRDRDSGEWDRGRDSGEWSRDRSAPPDGFWSEPGGAAAGGWGDPHRGRRGGQPALPATSSEPSASAWMRGWDAAAPEPVAERSRRSAPDDSGGYGWGGRAEEPSPARSARARSTGYDTGQERWG